MTIELPYQIIVRCKSCGLTGEAEKLELTEDVVNDTIGVLLWVNRTCPRCGTRAAEPEMTKPSY